MPYVAISFDPNHNHFNVLYQVCANIASNFIYMQKIKNYWGARKLFLATVYVRLELLNRQLRGSDVFRPKR